MLRLPFWGAAAGMLAVVAAPHCVAQETAQEPAFLAAGTPAPAVSLDGATRWGVLADPIDLEDFRGETVVLAFFPAARTRGCTIQMETYRDQYARLFNGGRDVVLVAISYDPSDELASWAHDADFPFLFASDPDGAAYRAFGGVPRENGHLGRTLVVIDPDGRIAELVPRFREIDPTAYDELQALLARVAPAESDE